MAVDCVNPVDCPTGAMGTAVSNPWDIVSPILNGGEPLVHVVKDFWPSLGVLFFKVEYTEKDGVTYMNYKFKNGGNGVGSAGRGFMPVRTNEDCAIEWREEVVCEAKTTVASNATTSNTIVVTNINDLKGIKVGNRILIVREATKQIIEADIHLISSNTITLANSQTVTVVAGDLVVRGAFNRDPSCTATIDNRFTVRDKKKYTSYFRKLNLTHRFNTCDLSLDRYSLMGEDGTVAYVNSLKAAGEEGFLRDFMDSVYFDRNLAEGNAVNENGATETMGLIPAIQAAQTATGKRYIKDYSACCDVESDTGCVNTDRMIGAWLETIMDAHQSGLYYNDVVTVACNNAQLRALLLLAPAMNEYFGLQVYTQNSMENGLQVGSNLPKIIYGGVTIDFVYEKAFDIMSWPFHVILPANQIALFQRKYQGINESLQLIEKINSDITGGTPMLRFIDRTPFDTNGMGDCFVFQAQFEFAVAYAGIDKDAYYIGTNFGSCDAVCDLCTDTTETEVIVTLEDA